MYAQDMEWCGEDHYHSIYEIQVFSPDILRMSLYISIYIYCSPVLRYSLIHSGVNDQDVVRQGGLSTSTTNRFVSN
jgi:hypothetical protein